ncbi:4a-hydroxytetrahydrobiopterin dehydratase, partial [Klebsiella pneumoniae]
MSRSFRFANFAEAFGFMAQMAAVSERLDHHPE